MIVSRRVARADALYFAIAISVTIIELAVIATTPRLGALALEYALIAQLTISILVEFGTAYTWIARFGIIRATHAGFFFKATSCCFFFGGIAVTDYSFRYSWTLILCSFLLDSMGTGLLKAAFRPAYSAMHYAGAGKPADYVNSLKDAAWIRLGLPCTIFCLIGVTHFFTNILNVTCAMFVIVISCRGVQILLARIDLRGIKLAPKEVLNKTLYSSASILTTLKKAPALWLCYIMGTVFESIILMYGIGLIYKYNGVTFLLESASWMGASAISLWIYLFSYAGAGWVIRRWSSLKARNMFLTVCSCLTGAEVFLLLLPPGGVGYLVGLVGFCFSASVSAILMIRLASTHCLILFDEVNSAKIFLWAELTANVVLIVVVGIAATLMGPDSIMRIFGILLGIFTATVAFLCSIRPWPYSDRTQ